MFHRAELPEDERTPGGALETTRRPVPDQERPRGAPYPFRRQGGFPRPETNVVIEGFEVDCVWRKQRVIIEVDGWETHKTRAAFERDREKSRILQAAGWRCVPVTYLQLEHTSAEVGPDVRRLLMGLPSLP